MLSMQISNIKSIPVALQPSPPSVFRTLYSSSQTQHHKPLTPHPPSLRLLPVTECHCSSYWSEWSRRALCFCDGLSSSPVVFPGSLCVAACVRISLLFKAERYSYCMDVVYPFICCFHLLTSVINASVNLSAHAWLSRVGIYA